MKKIERGRRLSARYWNLVNHSAPPGYAVYGFPGHGKSGGLTGVY